MRLLDSPMIAWSIGQDDNAFATMTDRDPFPYLGVRRGFRRLSITRWCS